MRAALLVIALAGGCYRGTSSVAEAERKGDAAWLGARACDAREGERAAAALARLAGRGHPEARAVLANRLAATAPGPCRDRLDAAARARLAAGDAGMVGLVERLAGDARQPFRAAAYRIRTAP